MRIVKKSISVIAISILMTTLVGCPQDRYKTAINAVGDYANALSAAQDIEIALYKDRQNVPINSLVFTTATEHKNLQLLFKQAADVGLVMNDAVKLSKNGATARTAFAQALSSFSLLMNDGVLRISNPEASAKLTMALLTAKAFLDIIQPILYPNTVVTSSNSSNSKMSFIEEDDAYIKETIQ